MISYGGVSSVTEALDTRKETYTNETLSSIIRSPKIIKLLRIAI